MPGTVEEKQNVEDLLRRALRHRRALFTGGAIILVGLTGTGITAVARYQPVELEVGPTLPMVFHANGTLATGAVKNVPGELPGDPATPVVTLAEPGMTVSVSNMLSDHGTFAVDILGVDTPFDMPFGARAEKIKVLMGDAHGSPATQPFRSFTLHPGDLRLLTIVLRPRICPGPDGHNGWATAEAQPVTYRFAGMTHRALVAFHGPGYGITGIVSC